MMLRQEPVPASARVAWPGLHASTALDQVLAEPPQQPSAFFTALQQADRDATDLETMRDDMARAVGYYDCPCGSEIEFDEDGTLEDYAALNRWLGEHFAADHGVSGSGPVDAERAADAAEFAALARREYQLVQDAAQCRRQRDAMAQLLEQAQMRAYAAEDAIGHERQRREEAEAVLAGVDTALAELRARVIGDDRG